MPLDYAISAFLTLFVVVDPIGLTPTFLAVTDRLPRTARRLVAVRASIIAGIVLAGSVLIGNWLLETLQISLAAFRIAGGLLLFSIASEMVFGVRIRREGEAAEQAVEEHVRNIAAFPLAIPLLAGARRNHGDGFAGRTCPRQLAVDRKLACRDCTGGRMLHRRLLFRRAHQRPSWHDREYRAVASARRATGRPSRAICGRRRASHFGRIGPAMLNRAAAARSSKRRLQWSP